MTIVFVDTYSPRPYTPATIDDARLGGSERSAMYIAEGLAKSGKLKVVFYQKHLSADVRSENGVMYRPLSELSTEKPSHLVVIRNMQLIRPMRELFNNTRLFIALDDLAQYCNLAAYQVDVPHTIICKSKWHREHIYKAIKRGRIKPDVVYAYNPTIVIPDIGEGELPVRDRNRLLYASSPHKGLDRALDIFRKLHKEIPSLRLHVANPGYLSVPDQCVDGVHYMGTLSSHALRKYMASSLCLFHPNNAYPETFGCVFTEANMVGTPVLTHKLGAAKEVLLATKEQRKANAVINTDDFDAVLSAIRRWQEADDVRVSCPAQFMEASVVERWRSVLGV